MIKNHLQAAYHQARNLDNGLDDAIVRLAGHMGVSDPFVELLKLYKKQTKKIVSNLEVVRDNADFMTKGDKK